MTYEIQVAVHFFTYGLPVAQAPLIESTILPPLICFAPLSEINWPHLSEDSAGSVFCAHWDVCLSLCW
jgi:hypothetical protein